MSESRKWTTSAGSMLVAPTRNIAHDISIAMEDIHCHYWPRYYKSKRRGKQTGSYVIDTRPDGYPQWVDKYFRRR